MSENATLVPMRQRVAEEIRVLLARRRMSGSELARQIGASQPYVSRRLTGEIAFDVDDLEKIAAALDVQPSDLLIPKTVTGTYQGEALPTPTKRIQKRPPTRKDTSTRPPSTAKTSHRPVLFHRRAKT